MLEFLRKLIDYVPEFINSGAAKKLIPWFFWPATVFMSLLLIPYDPVSGSLMVGVPLLFAALTRYFGVMRVPTIIVLLTGVAAMFPAFFLGLGQRNEKEIPLLPLLGLASFVVWIAAYPPMLTRFNHRYWQARYPDEEIGVDEPAAARIMTIQLWLAVVVMWAVGDEVAPLVGLIALCYRRQWTAVTAALVCLVSPFVIYQGGWWFEFDLAKLLGAVLAAKSWLEAARLPMWNRRVSY
ncbi:hypothetical protein KIPE111705_18890 [Kibdelosporangium persicum]|uniref:Uncharacterized protein n=1 Tax=Kibdelosporangium persicum TaxID=2698649 RepID=A0ABX2FA89_9PSEU|nr:hypothetical protein [Kibdelosporangium persicum]NRN68274.1 hypothetical protein [Kibdelosporangium persicum]